MSEPTAPAERMIDLDARIAERREARGQALEVRLGGVNYLLPIEMPMEAVQALGHLADVGDVDESTDPAVAAATMRTVSNTLDDGLAVMFCTCDELPQAGPDDPDTWRVGATRVHDPDCQWPGFARNRPSLDTRMDLLHSLWAAYGVSLGEALGPDGQSTDTSGPSARTSSGTTGATSATSGGGKPPTDRKAPAKAAAARKQPAKKAAPRKRAAAKPSA